MEAVTPPLSYWNGTVVGVQTLGIGILVGPVVTLPPTNDEYAGRRQPQSLPTTPQPRPSRPCKLPAAEYASMRIATPGGSSELLGASSILRVMGCGTLNLIPTPPARPRKGKQQDPSGAARPGRGKKSPLGFWGARGGGARPARRPLAPAGRRASRPLTSSMEGMIGMGCVVSSL